MSSPTAGGSRQGPPAKKRRINLVTPQGKSIASGSLRKPSLDKDGNDNIRMLIIHLHELFSVLFGFKEEDMLKIELMGRVTSHLWTVYTVTKQIVNGSGTVKDKVPMESKLTLNGIERTVNELVYLFKEVCKMYDFQFSNDLDAMSNKRGSFQSNFAQYYVYKFRYHETVYMNKHFRIVNTDGEERGTPMTDYGCQSAHLGLAYGANFTPAMQAATMQQLGPVALTIGLMRQTDQRYQGKWKSAFVQQMSGVPRAAELAELLAGSNGEHKEVSTALFDLCGMGIAKVSCKAALPWAVIRIVMQKHARYLAWTKGIGEKTTNGETIFQYGSRLTRESVHPDFLKLDYSGKGFWNYYNLAAKEKLKCLQLDSVIGDVYAQNITMAITGLYYDDINVVKQVFGREPRARCEMGGPLKDIGTKGTYKDVKLWPAKKVCKLATAAQTKMGVNQDHEIMPVYRMSGFGSQALDEKSLLIRNLNREQRGDYPVYNTGVMAILQELKAFGRSAGARLLAQRSLDSGTTSWFEVDATSNADNYGTPVDDVVKRCGQTVFASKT